MDSIAKKGRLQGGEERKARRASLGEVEGSMSGWVDEKGMRARRSCLEMC